MRTRTKTTIDTTSQETHGDVVLTHSTDCSWRGELEVMGFENEVDVVSEADSFSVGQREQVVVVQHGVERLDPLRVNVAVAY